MEPSKTRIKKIASFVFAVMLLGEGASSQDTLNFIYQRSKEQGSQFANEQHKILIANSKQTKTHTLISIKVDTFQYEIHANGFNRQLFFGTEPKARIEYQIIVLGGIQYKLSVGTSTYLFKKTKDDWTCYDGEQKILSIGFYRKDKQQLIQLVAIKTAAEYEVIKTAAIYCADDLLRNKKTTFGKIWRKTWAVGF